MRDKGVEIANGDWVGVFKLVDTEALSAAGGGAKGSARASDDPALLQSIMACLLA